MTERIKIQSSRQVTNLAIQVLPETTRRDYVEQDRQARRFAGMSRKTPKAAIAPPPPPPRPCDKGNDRRKKILDFLVSYFEEKGFAPSIREIGDAIGLKSSSTVFAHLQILQASGHIAWDKGKPRNIQVLADNQKRRSVIFYGSEEELEMLSLALESYCEQLSVPGSPQNRMVQRLLEALK